MDFFLTLFHTFLFQPLFNALVVIYNLIPGRDFGIAVIILTLLFRLLFYPLSAQALRAQKKLSALQPKIREVQERFKSNKDGQGKALLELYRKEQINPFAAFLPFLIQLPVLIGLYQVFWRGLRDEQLSSLYSFVSNPGVIDPSFLGLVDLGERSFPLALAAGIFQFFQTKQITPPKDPKAKKKSSGPDFASTLQTQMLYVFPVLTVIIFSRLPSAVALYWIVTSIFTIWQYRHLTKKLPTQPPQHDGSQPKSTH